MSSVPSLQRHALSGATMGTRYSAVFFAAAGVAESAIGAALFAAADKVDRQMSTWKPDSDLSRLNAMPAHQWLAVPDELLVVLDTALRVGVQSNGAFDVGVGDLVDAWGFGPSGPMPDEGRARALKAHAHHPASDVLEIDLVQKRVRKRAAITLDLSGIAKGYGVDALAGCLDGFGITRYLVGIDGEMRAKGHKPDGQAWAIATSGDYRRWVEVGGLNFAHTMDPRSGRPVDNHLASVSVVMPTCMWADAWATALLVMGAKTATEMAQKKGMTALLVVREGDTFEEISLIDGQLQA